jgi:phage terminase large subunit-like protein
LTNFYFDKEAGSKAIGFIETFCSHAKGELAGKPLLLEDWQKKIIGDLFGWKNKKTNLRKYRTAFIEVPRKNGKSTLCAAIGLYMLFSDSERGSEIYSAAGDRSQAGIVFEIAKQMILNNYELSKRAKIFRNSITNESKGNFYQAISSDSKTKHGLNANTVIFDELHTQPNRDLWDTLLTSTGARREPLCLAISTAGYDRQSICWEIYNYAKQVKDKIIQDDSFYSCIYEADIEDDITDEKIWKKANPNYGISLRKEYMKRESQRAMDVPSYQNTFKRLMLNIWTDSLTAWISNSDWEKCEAEIDMEKLKGKKCWAGLDLASTRDLSALVLLFKEEDKFILIPYCFIPEENAKKRSERDKVDYVNWIKQNHIIGTSGDVADYNFIKQKIMDLGLEYNIQSIAYDRWNASQLVIDLTNEGVEMAPFGQGFKSMSAPTKELEKLILGNQILHNGNPVMSWALSNIAIQEDPAGNLKPNKAKSTERIDPIVSAIMALGEYMTEEDINSVYDNRGLLIL